MPIRPTSKKKSTSTIYEEKYLVPWLASAGPLSYAPEKPPPSNYYFQYTWILPQIFHPQMNLRQHLYFGALHKRQARFLFRFWERARVEHLTCRFFKLGVLSQRRLEAPIAVYDHAHEHDSTRGVLLIQHGSYQWLNAENQPLVDMGQVLLYRGVEQAPVFRWLSFEPEKRSASSMDIFRRYLSVQVQMLSDSALSFNTIHDRTQRCETSHLRDHTFLSDELAIQSGLDISSPGFARRLWAATHQSYSLELRMAELKFGPHYVVFRTPLSNIRITTFFAGEAEARIVDPTSMTPVDAVGCSVEMIAAN